MSTYQQKDGFESRTSFGTSFRIRFTAAGEHLRGAPKRKSGFDPFAQVRHMIDPKLAQAMIDAEPRLLAWLRASREHLIAFTMDPMTALRAALPDFDPAMLRQIAAIRAASRGVTPDLPGVTIDRFDVEVAPDEKAK